MSFLTHTYLIINWVTVQLPFCQIRMIDLILQAITKTYKIMYSNKDYEKLWQKYQTEGIAHNMTLQMFCSMNNVPYNSFEKYLKTRRAMSDIHPVNITDIPHEDVEQSDTQSVSPAAKESNRDSDAQVRILVNISIYRIPGGTPEIAGVSSGYWLTIPTA